MISYTAKRRLSHPAQGLPHPLKTCYAQSMMIFVQSARFDLPRSVSHVRSFVRSFGVRYKETPRGPANPMLTPGPNDMKSLSNLS